MSTIIGRKIKQLRLVQKKKLKDLSESTGLSISYLSKLERENFTVSSKALEKIAAALDVSIEYFYEGPSIIRSYERVIGYEEDEMMSVEKLTATSGNNNMAAVIVNILPGNEQKAKTPHSHAGEEFVYVMEGTLTVFLNDIEHVLYPGDSLYFPAEHSHLWINKTNKMVRFLDVSSAPKKWESYKENTAALLDDR